MTIQLHGSFLEVHGLGVLLRGPSGIGKSETALELVARGHRLVADDLVRFEVEAPYRNQPGWLVGTAPDLIRHHIEIRGLGILKVPELYGPGSIRERCRLELVCHFELWKGPDQYERVGLLREEDEILGIRVPRVTLPARTVANLATLVDVAVRDHANRRAGEISVRSLDQRIKRNAGRSDPGNRRKGGP